MTNILEIDKLATGLQKEYPDIYFIIIPKHLITKDKWFKIKKIISKMIK